MFRLSLLALAALGTSGATAKCVPVSSSAAVVSSSTTAVSSSVSSSATTAPSNATTSGVDAFIATERPIALQGALNNIGPNGTLVDGAIAGLVVASPSKANPNCKTPLFHLYSHPNRHTPNRHLRMEIKYGGNGWANWHCYNQISTHGVGTRP